MIKPKISTKVVNGKERVENLRRVLSQYKEAYVTIGIHSDAGKYPSNVDVVEVALWNEFGTKDVPERSYFRSALSEHESQINQWREEMISNILEKGWDIPKALEAMGLRIQILVQNKIKSNVPPPYGTGKNNNSPDRIASLQAAKAKKTGGNVQTLQDTLLLLRSVTFKVVLN